MNNEAGSDLVPQDDRNVAMNHFDVPVQFLEVRSACIFDESDEAISFFGKAYAQL